MQAMFGCGGGIELQVSLIRSSLSDGGEDGRGSLSELDDNNDKGKFPTRVDFYHFTSASTVNGNEIKSVSTIVVCVLRHAVCLRWIRIRETRTPNLIH